MASRRLDQTILYYTILYYIILYHTIPCYTILYYTILYYTILYYTLARGADEVGCLVRGLVPAIEIDQAVAKRHIWEPSNVVTKRRLNKADCLARKALCCD